MALKRRKNKSPAPDPLCPLGECMRLIGGAWTPNVIWYLRGGERRFSELRADIPAVSAKVLTARLRELETKGVVWRAVRPTSPPSVEYALTDLGRALVPAIEAIVAVGKQLKRSGDGVRRTGARATRVAIRKPAGPAARTRDARSQAVRAETPLVRAPRG